MPVEVKRTLVKSPPELWAELSDPASLARHLGEFGDIRTVRTEPETSVEWEATDVRGTVEIKPSGWGTRVTLSVVRETPAPEPEASEPEPEPVEPEAEPEAAEPPVLPEAVEPEAEPDATEPEPAEPPARRRRGFFARLFRRRHAEPVAEPEPTPTAEPELVTEPVAEAPEPESRTEPEPEPTPDLAAELAEVEEAMAEQDAALLTAVLDRLGAAHHRPFSRG